MAARILTITNQKGGVAKTTTAIHLAAALADAGERVLLVDLDAQGHVAESFGIVSDHLESEMSDVLEGKRRLREITVEVSPRLHVAPSNLRLADMELTLVTLAARESRLKRAFKGQLRGYDYVIIDCPPNLGLLTINALLAARQVLIPMHAEFLSMLGVGRLLATIEQVRATANPALEILGIIHTRVKGRTIHAREVIERTRAELGDSIPVFEHAVPETVRFQEAAGLGTTLFELEGTHPGAEAYRKIAEEIRHRGTS